MMIINSLKPDNKAILKSSGSEITSFSNNYQSLNAIKASTIAIPTQLVNSITYEGNPVNTYQSRPVSSYCEITELVDGYKFIYPLLIKIVNLRKDQIFIAECYTFNLYSESDTYEGSLDGIKSLLVDDYLAFKKNYPDRLTNGAVSVLRLYCAFFGQDLP